MNKERAPQIDLNILNERLARDFYANGRYNPQFLAVSGFGFLVIYFLTRFGIFGQSAPQLILIGFVILLLGATQAILLPYARRNYGIAVNLWSSACFGIAAILLTYLWQGISFVAILISLITPITLVRAKLPRRYLIVLVLIVVSSITGILYADNNSTYERLQNSTPAAIASFTFLLATGLLLATIIAIAQTKGFKSLRTLLMTSFIAIVTIPTVMAAILSTIGAFTNSQTQTFSTLSAITNLKEDQIRNLVNDSQNDATRLLNDNIFVLNAIQVLTTIQTDPQFIENLKRIVRIRAKDVVGAEEEAYSEIMILNTQGEVIISTLPENEGQNYENQVFFRQGALRFYTGFTDIESFGDENLIVATPLYDSGGQVIRGIVVLRSNANSIKRIMENTTGFDQGETYLVDTHYKPVTLTKTLTDLVSTRASLETIGEKVESGQEVYQNYANEPVLGYYKWFEEMQVAIVGEVPLSYVIVNSARSLAGSAILATIVISLAIAAVAFSSNTITYPIILLAQTTESFAAGKFSSRAPVDRADEIGALAKSYNQMAEQLQETIGNLENRVSERTRDLASQSERLRMAAEIARDSASASDLRELLERSSQLIQARFGFDHTGILLLDNNNEYIILAASPSDAGKKMIAENFKLRVGGAGIIARVASAGEPRVTFDTATDPSYLSHPYLAGTRSEMALPLKTENKVIGVLDIQSNEVYGFSEDDVAIMQILADQLATAIERARLLQEVERSLKELESAYGQYTRDNWKLISESTTTGNKGYYFDNIRIEPVTELSELGKRAVLSGKTVTSNNEGSDNQTSVAVPVKLRGQTIGVINLKLKENYGEDTVSTIELASERLAASLESARLYEEARMRADREQSISQVTSAISASTGYEEILQTTIREIGTTLRDTEVTIQITGISLDNESNN